MEMIAETTADYHAEAIRNIVLFGAVIVVGSGVLAVKVWGCL